MLVEGRETTRMQDAVRLLLLINAAAESLGAPPPDDDELAEAIAVLRTQLRLQKLDFWLRNPDYLANELLNDYEKSGEPGLLVLAADILNSEEPEVRRYPMLRYLFGAYEPLDDALAVLRTARLVVRRRRGTIERTMQHDYYLLYRGREVAERISSDYPEFSYYRERTALVVALADGTGGPSQLKARQYLQNEYASAKYGDRIGSIAERARARLAGLLEAGTAP